MGARFKNNMAAVLGKAIDELKGLVHTEIVGILPKMQSIEPKLR